MPTRCTGDKSKGPGALRSPYTPLLPYLGQPAYHHSTKLDPSWAYEVPHMSTGFTGDERQSAGASSPSLQVHIIKFHLTHPFYSIQVSQLATTVHSWTPPGLENCPTCPQDLQGMKAGSGSLETYTPLFLAPGCHGCSSSTQLDPSWPTEVSHMSTGFTGDERQSSGASGPGEGVRGG